jgi:hypothetical protein
MLRRKRAIVATALVAFVVTACGASSAKTEPKAGPTRTSADPTPALLSLRDLPTGWTKDTRSTQDRDRLCAQVSIGKTAAQAHRATAHFSAAPTNGPTLSEQIVAFPDPGRAMTFMAATRRSVTTYHRGTSTPDGRLTPRIPTALPFPSVGDSSYAVRLPGTTSARATVLDCAYARQGAIVLRLALEGPADVAQLDALTHVALARTRLLTGLN